MMTRLTTCCYCGTRAALVLRDHGHMELSCKGCGAPITQLKQMPDRKASSKSERPEKSRAKHAKPRKKKKKSPYHRAFKEMWDVLDDIFD